MERSLDGTLHLQSFQHETAFPPHTRINPLQELSNGVEEGGDTADSHAGAVGDSGTGAGGRAGTASAGGGARLAVGGGGVGDLGVTLEGTLDDGLADVLEVGAVEGTVSALQVEATLNISQTIKVDAVKTLVVRSQKTRTRLVQVKLTC